MKTIKSSIYLSTEKSGGWIFPLLIVELLGISLGAFFAANSENSGILRKYICPEVYGGAFLQVFLTAFAAYFAYLLLSFLLGLFLFGQGGGVLLLCCLGTEIGCTASHMYMENGTAAIMWIILLYLPTTAVISLIGILSAREVIRNSTALLKSTVSSAEPPPLKSYCLRFILLTVGALLLSVLYGLANHFFSV